MGFKCPLLTPNDWDGQFGSSDLIKTAIGKINVLGLSTLYGNDSFTDYDVNEDDEMDLVVVVVRNATQLHGGKDKGGGTIFTYIDLPIKMSDGSYYPANGTYQCVGDDDQSIFYNGVLIHELSHFLFGDNEQHTSGGAAWMSENGITFFGTQGGYGIMGGGNSGLTSCNGYERWRMHWKSETFNTTGEYIAANNQVSDISQEDGSRTFLLRDFVTTGDAIRIKLPYKDQNGLNQYIWLENHKVESEQSIDFLLYSIKPPATQNCRPRGKSGIYAYYQIGKDILSGYEDDVRPHEQADNLKIISAEGNFEVTRSDFPIICIGSGTGSAYTTVNPNLFLGVNDVIKVGYENMANETEIMYDDFRFGWKRITPEYTTDSIPHLMDDREPFRGNGVINTTSNPPTVNTYTYYNSTNGSSITPLNPTQNTRSIYLSGLSISYNRQGNDDYEVSISWGDYEVDKEVRWCGNIVHNEKLYLVESAKVTLDQSKTPEQKYRDPVSGEFALPTIFTCNSGSYLYMNEESRIQLKEKSTMLLKSGSVVYISDDASITVENGCILKLNPVQRSLSKMQDN